MSIKNLVRYYSEDKVNLVMLKRHKYICINDYDESFNVFLDKPQTKQFLALIAQEYNISIYFQDNQSNSHLMTPNAIILVYQDYIFIHPRLANLFFSCVYPQLNIKIKISCHNKERKGYIYVLEGINILKIGYSTNIEKRIKQLSRWSNELELIAKIEGTIGLEKSIHHTLHLTGDYFGDEWYPSYRKNEILSLIDESVDSQIFQPNISVN